MTQSICKKHQTIEKIAKNSSNIKDYKGRIKQIEKMLINLKWPYAQ